MELFHKLCAVVLCDACKPHCIEEDLPCATVTTSLPPLDQTILNCFLLARVALITQLNLLWGKPHPLKDGFTLAGTLSADILSEEHSISITSCKGDKRWHYWANPVIWAQHPTHNSEVNCLCSASLNSTQVHMFTHSALAVWGQGPCQWELPQTCSGQPPSHLHTTDERSWNGNWWH